MRTWSRVLSSTAAICTCVLGSAAAPAPAATTARLHVGLSPERLGSSTTLSFGFTISEGHALPPALTVLDVRLPAGMGVDLSGLEACAEHALLAHGQQGCSSDSQVGSGSVEVRVPLGNVIRTEQATLTVFNGPRRGSHATLLFYAVGRLPIATQLIFTGVILPSPAGQSIEAAIPLIPTLPEAPDAAIVAMSSTISTRQRTYYRTVGHRRMRIAPKGAILPARCPAGGFPFSASFTFNDSSTASAATTVACPHQGKGKI